MRSLEQLTIILIAISLSIDAFTLSVAYGLLNIKKKKIIITSITVGIFHFFMPLIGLIIGNFITNKYMLDSKFILIVTLIIILIEMIKSYNEEIIEKDLSLIETITFSFLVSIDSLLIGAGITYITSNIILSCIYFSIFSFLFTLGGFLLGKYITQKSKQNAKIISIIIIFTLIIYFLCK